MKETEGTSGIGSIGDPCRGFVVNWIFAQVIGTASADSNVLLTALVRHAQPPRLRFQEICSLH